MEKNAPTSRRDALKKMGLLGAAGTTAVLGLSTQPVYAQDQTPILGQEASETGGMTGNKGENRPVGLSSREGFRVELKQWVDSTPLVDSHEHLQDEWERLRDKKNCIRLFSHYLGDDFVSAGLDRDSVFGEKNEKKDPVELWRLLEPYWNAVKNTGYGRAVRITIKELYGIDTLNESVIPPLQKAFEELAVPGFYEKILRGHCNLESCQVDRGAYTETTQPTLLLQDINIYGFQTGSVSKERTKRVGINEIKDLNDYHRFIEAWFQKYGRYATAIKSAIAYGRGLDFDQVPAELVEEPFKKKRDDQPVTPEEDKLIQDHLFWFCVEQANQYQLPVKLHTGYYAGSNSMKVSRVEQNVAQAADLCLRSPKTRFMFMHTAYPYGHELISVAKQFSNAYVQTCWAWIIDPVGTKNFLKQYIVAAPSNKIHTFGGDYLGVENVVGHARIARNGVFAALDELVDEGYLDQEEALELVEPLLRGNARKIFALETKYEAVQNVPWDTTPKSGLSAFLRNL